MKRIGIGPSVGWYFAQGIYPMANHISFLKQVGATAVEVPLTGFDPEDKRFAALVKAGNLKAELAFLAHKSLHLPDYNGETDSEGAEQGILVQQFKEKRGFDLAVIHPLKWHGEYPERYFEEFTARGIPLAIENMDKDKESGFLIKDLVRLLEAHDLSFVLDLQHAYEQDPKMGHARDLFAATQHRLSHLHVSGESTSNIHSLVRWADNRAVIMEFLTEIFSQKPVSIILEGKYTRGNELELAREIDFMKKWLSL